MGFVLERVQKGEIRCTIWTGEGEKAFAMAVDAQRRWRGAE